MLFMDFILGFSLFFFKYINLFFYFVVIKLLNLWFYFPCWKFSFHTLLQTCDLCTETQSCSCMGVYFFEKSLSFLSPILCVVFQILKLPQYFNDTAANGCHMVNQFLRFQNWIENESCSGSVLVYLRFFCTR